MVHVGEFIAGASGAGEVFVNETIIAPHPHLVEPLQELDQFWKCLPRYLSAYREPSSVLSDVASWFGQIPNESVYAGGAHFNVAI